MRWKLYLFSNESWDVIFHLVIQFVLALRELEDLNPFSRWSFNRASTDKLENENDINFFSCSFWGCGWRGFFFTIIHTDTKRMNWARLTKLVSHVFSWCSRSYVHVGEPPTKAYRYKGFAPFTAQWILHSHLTATTVARMRKHAPN